VRNDCVRAKTKTVVAEAILIYSAILKFRKKTSTLFFSKTFFPNPKFQLICINIDSELWEIHDWRPSWFCPPFCLFWLLFNFFIFFNDMNYKIIGSTLNLKGIEKIRKMWWNMIKKIFIWEKPDPSSISESELIDNE
jgi:hypothetical protein